MKKIIVIGASGTIGKAIVEQLGLRHEVITVGRSSGQFQVKIEDPASVEALFQQVGKVDGVVVAAGDVHFGPLGEMTAEQFKSGLDSKLMGQVNVALAAQKHLNDGGSITLTSGSLSENPIRFGANASTVNAAVEGFVLGAAIELPRGLRINAISPTLVDESVDVYGPYFYGMETVPVKRAALAYSRSVEGAENGKTYRVW
ncbi:short chain dehydrogenase [Pseudoduganella sp. OTU4001]|uniref:short chain dehydrogenase n=1 Tax=Pseudoduganella sp. OTU4001 TaxID=3043854 RepID=UPI00313B249C